MVDIFLLETLEGCPKLLHFRLLISETSRSISLWINNKANPFNLAFVIVQFEEMRMTTHIHKL